MCNLAVPFFWLLAGDESMADLLYMCIYHRHILVGGGAKAVRSCRPASVELGGKRHSSRHGMHTNKDMIKYLMREAEWYGVSRAAYN